MYDGKQFAFFTSPPQYEEKAGWGRETSLQF